MKYILVLSFLWLSISLYSQSPRIQVQLGHTEGIKDMDISQDGRWLATAGYDRQVKIWEINTGRQLANQSVFDEIANVAFLPFAPNVLLIAGKSDVSGYNMLLMNVEANKVFLFHKGENIKTMSINDSSVLMVNTYSGTAYIYSLVDTLQLAGLIDMASMGMDDTEMMVSEKNGTLGISGRSIDSLTGDALYAVGFTKVRGDQKTTNVYSGPYKAGNLQISSNDRYAAFTKHDPGGIKLNIYDLEMERIIDSMYIHSYEIADGNEVIINRADNSLVRYDMERRAIINTLMDSVNIETISVSGKYVAASSTEGDWSIVNKTSSDVVQYVNPVEPRRALAVSQNGEALAVNGEEGEIVFWNLQTNRVYKKKYHNAPVNKLRLSHDANHLFSASTDGRLIHYNMLNLDTIPMVPNLLPNVEAVELTNTEESLIVSYMDSMLIYYWNIPEAEGGPYLYDKVPLASKIQYAGVTKGDSFAVYVFEGNVVTTYDLMKDEIIEQAALIHGGNNYRLSPKGNWLSYNSASDTTTVVDIIGKIEVVDYITNLKNTTATAFSLDERYFFSGHPSGIIYRWDMDTYENDALLVGHNGSITDMQMLRDGKFMISSSSDGSMAIWKVNTAELVGHMYLFADGSWAVLDTMGRYDASNAGNIGQLHFAYNMETIDLFQLKDRYYEPGLLQKLLEFSDEPLRDVEQLNSIAMYPETSLTWKDEDRLLLDVTIKKRDGGVGQIPLYINGKELMKDITQGKPLPDSATITVDLSAYRNYLMSDQLNKVSVQAYNAEGYLSSRYITEYFDYQAPTRKIPKLFALIIGTSAYVQPELILKYADEDAKLFCEAITAASSELLGKENVVIKQLNTSLDQQSWPTKSAIQSALADFAKEAYANDIILIYLSGHGISRSDEEQFYYLTKDVTSPELDDPVVRSQFAISTDEWTKWLNAIPANKQVMIIDACASGQIIEDLMGKGKGISPSQVRALEQLNNATGMYILAGSAADQKSYEASRYGMSILTYSILLGMQGPGLETGNFVDVESLFKYVKREVPDLSRGIGGVQEPQYHIPPQSKGEFNIGRMNEGVSIHLPMPKPIIVRGNFQETNEFDDVWHIGEAVNDILLDYSAMGRNAPLIYVDVKPFASTYYITGGYEVNGDDISFNGRVQFRLNDNQTDRIGLFSIPSGTANKENIGKMVVSEALQIVQEYERSRQE